MAKDPCPGTNCTEIAFDAGVRVCATRLPVLRQRMMLPGPELDPERYQGRGDASDGTRTALSAYAPAIMPLRNQIQSTAIAVQFVVMLGARWLAFDSGCPVTWLACAKLQNQIRENAFLGRMLPSLCYLGIDN